MNRFGFFAACVYEETLAIYDELAYLEAHPEVLEEEQRYRAQREHALENLRHLHAGRVVEID